MKKCIALFIIITVSKWYVGLTSKKTLNHQMDNKNTEGKKEYVEREEGKEERRLIYIVYLYYYKLIIMIMIIIVFVWFLIVLVS